MEKIKEFLGWDGEGVMCKGKIESGKNPQIKMQRFGKPFAPGRKQYEKKKTLKNAVVFLLIFSVASAGLTILIGHVIRCSIIPGQEETWAASVASYWGGIIGGLLSGILAFIGVFWTIRYYKESDDKKERASLQPFLKIILDQRPHLGDAGVGFALGNVEKKDVKRTRINVVITNIGNGFATTLAIRNGENFGGLKYNRVISVQDSTKLFFMVDSTCLSEGISFDLQFVDSMTNEYIQSYKLIKDGSQLEIECGYPHYLRV